MFRNSSLYRIMSLEDQLVSIEYEISEASFRWDFEAVSGLERVYKELSQELDNLKMHHKESLEHDYELVYSSEPTAVQFLFKKYFDKEYCEYADVAGYTFVSPDKNKKFTVCFSGEIELFNLSSNKAIMLSFSDMNLELAFEFIGIKKDL